MIGTASAVLSPATPPPSGIAWTISGADAADFVINSSTGVLNVGTSDVAVGTYHINLIATNSLYSNSPFSAPQTIIGASASGSGPFVLSNTPTGSFNNSGAYANGENGMTITVGGLDLSVTSLGRFIGSGNDQPHNLRIVHAASMGQVGPTLTITPPYGSPGAYLYVNYSAPVVLAAGQTYYVLSTESQFGSPPGTDYFYQDDWAVTTTADATINGSAQINFGINHASTGSTPNREYGPVNFQYSVTSNPAAIPGSPFSPVGRATIVMSPPSAIPAVTGMITLDLSSGQAFFSSGVGGSPAPNPNTITGQWWVDGAPVGPYVRGPQVNSSTPPFFPVTLDTTTLADGTHHAFLQIVDSQDNRVDGATCAFMFLGLGFVFISHNHTGLPYTSGAQTIPVWQPSPVQRPLGALPDFASYDGDTIRPVNTFDYPWTFAPPFSDATPVTGNPYANGTFGGGAAALRTASSYYIPSVMHVKLNEYEFDQTICTTLNGGVVTSGFSPVMGDGTLGTISNVTTTYPWDGGRYDDRISPYSTWICDPAPPGGHNGIPNASASTSARPFFQVNGYYDTQGFSGIEEIGRVVHLDLNGKSLTIAGLTLDRDSKLPYDFYSSQTLIGTPGVFAPYKTVGTMSGFSNWQGLNDLCYDPRNSNILYVCNILWNTIIKIDTSTNPPTCSRFAGVETQTGAYSGDGGSPLSAHFDQPSSIIMGSDGTMYIADKFNSCIRTINPAGTVISTLAGNQTSKPTRLQVAGGNGTSPVWLPVPQAAAFTGGISGNTLTVTAVSSGTIVVNGLLHSTNPSFGQGTTVIALGTGTGGTGTYTLTSNGSLNNVSPGSSFTQDLVTSPPQSGQVVSFTPGNNSTGAYVNFPNTIKFAAGATTSSTAKIVVYELDTRVLRQIDLAANTVTLLAAGYWYLQGSRLNNPPAVNDGFAWFDIDAAGTLGNGNDILVIDFVWESAWFTFDGSYQAQFQGNSGGAFYQRVNWDGGTFEGKFNNTIIDPIGGYAWIIAMHTAQCAFVSGGFHNLGVNFWRTQLTSDPDPNWTDANVDLYTLGYLIWSQGSPICFPRNARPPFAALHGGHAFGHLGSDIAPTAHDICVVYNGGSAAYNGSLTTYAISSMILSSGHIAIAMGVSTFVEGVGNYVYVTGNGNSTFNGFFRVAAYTDNQHFTVAAPSASGSSSGSPVINTGDAVLCKYFQAGASGAVPRPEFDPAGNDWRALSFYIRRVTTAGSYPTVALPGPANSDLTPPQFLTFTATRIDFTTVTVTWTSDKDAIGMACGGSDANFNHPFQATVYNLQRGGLPMLYSSWSPIETAFVTAGGTHTATVTWLPKSLPTHISAVMKDRAGNPSYASDIVVGASPDGSYIGNGHTGKLVTQYGEWSFGDQIAGPPGYGGGPLQRIMLNGKPASGATTAIANILMVDFGGQLFAAGIDLNWYGYGGYAWQSNTSGSISGPNNDPMPGLISGFNPPYTPSADGTTSSTGPLISGDGVWTIDGSGHVNLNGIPLNGGGSFGTVSANMLAINAHGQAFYHDPSTVWHVWQNNQANAVTGTPPTGGIPTGMTFTNFAGGGPYPIVSGSTNGLVVLTIGSIAMSDGSTFAGTITTSDADGGGLVTAVSGMNIVTANAPITTVGHLQGVTLTQNGCSVTMIFDMQVH